MFVLQNPGNPIPGVEEQLEDGVTFSELAARLWHLTGAVLQGRYYSQTLSTALQEASQLVGLPPQRCTEQVMFTNLVRCTTKPGRMLDDEAIRIGTAWLREEIELWQPEVVVAYGSVARDGMRRNGIHFDVALPHPAARGSWSNRTQRNAWIAEARQHLRL